MERSKFYVTTPIYYVNDRPHIGHAYTTILADVLARYHRLLGLPTFFLTGTDEHGQKVQRAAEKAGMTPQQQADETVVRFQELWKRLEITHDDFIRTTEPRHARVVQDILQDLHDRGEIYPATYDGWYCVPCERFFTEKDLVDGACPDCHRPVERFQEKNYFFKMGRRQEWLIRYIEEHPGFIQPDFRRNETLGFLRTRPLQDLCISRPKSRLSWGIELPFDADYVTYVWFDALINYISAIGYRRDDAQFRRWWPASYHLIGKDILTTHTVYWPIMLEAMGVPQPEAIFAHGWWLTGDQKMSKSLGNVINPMDMVERFGVDAFRYFLMAEMVLGNDASFTEEAFTRRYNADLANDLGNLLSRLVKMIRTYGAGALPAPENPAAPAGAQEQELWAAVQAAVSGMEGGLATMRLDQGIATTLAAVRATNRYLEVRAPWTQAKQADRAPLGTTLYTAAEALRVCATLFYPVMPGKMQDIRRALGLDEAEPTLALLRQWGVLKPGTPLGEAVPLFPRMLPPGGETPAAPAEAAATPPAAAPKAAKKPARKEIEPAAELEYDEFARLSLRTAKVVAADRVAGADKLLKLQVDLGGETRQIVAGIAQHYTPEQLVGKTVVVLANLKPAVLRGEESRGMLLAATGPDGAVRVLTPDGDVPGGCRVK